MQCVNLTDNELWCAIADNTNEMSELHARKVELDAEICGWTDANGRAHLMRAHLDVVKRVQREYRTYTAELRRRYPSIQQDELSRVDKPARTSLRDSFAKDQGVPAQ